LLPAFELPGDEAIGSSEPAEVDTWQRRLLEPPWTAIAIIFIITGYIIPVGAWLFRGVRRNFFLMFVTTVLVNIGMWLERYMIVIPGLERKSNLTFQYGDYLPSAAEFGIIAAQLALVIAGFLVFSKLLPIMPAADIKEGQILRDEIKVGRARVPATMREA